MRIFIFKPDTTTMHVHAHHDTICTHGITDDCGLLSDIRKAIGEDDTQRKALQLAFDTNVTLVQGPPGTGKTYIGVQMVKAFLELDRHTHASTILCVCYTNHALDSFLEELLDAGVDEELFVRLGKSPKISDRLKGRCLDELKTDRFSKDQNRQFGVMKDNMKAATEKIRQIQDGLEKSAWGKGEKWWQTIQVYLEEFHHEAARSLTLPRDFSHGGYQVAGRGGSTIKANYLWEQWLNGKDPGVFKNSIAGGIWKLTREQRQSHKNQWNDEWRQEIYLDALEYQYKKLTQLHADMNYLKSASKIQALNQYRIVGCTTVKAAQLGGLLDQSIVLIEEAGEILEAQVLTNLSDKCKQLIMIGTACSLL